MTKRQEAIRGLEIATAHVVERVANTDSAPQWREHLRRNSRKLRWLRFLETR